MLKTTGSRLAAALLAYVILIVLLLTLNPFYFVLPRQISISVHLYPDDIIENIVLFLPIGFLYRLVNRQGKAMLLGFLISTCIETTQLFIPARISSLIDLSTNTLGAGLGAAAFDLFFARLTISPNLLNRLRLKTPLMGFLYLLIPLNWVNALMLETSPHRWPLLALIGVCGAIVLSTEFRQRYQAPTLPELGYIAMSAALWFISGSGPGLLLSPLHVGLIGGGVIALTIGLILLPIKSTGQGFEQAALRIVIPVFVLYLAMSVLWPPLRPLGSWHGMLGLRYTDRLLPRINYLMAFTVFGYLLAEWRGWAGVGWQRDLPRVLGIAIAASFTLEFLAGFQIGNGASLLRSATVIAGALFGSVLYHLSWAHIQYLLRRTQ